MDFPVVPTDPGVSRQVLAENPDLMMVKFTFADDSEGKLHEHPHVQATYVRSGRFTFTLGDRTHDLGPGDSLLIPSGVRHGCICHEAGELIDTFTPRRDDFL